MRFRLSDYLSYPATFYKESSGYSVCIHHSNEERYLWLTDGSSLEDAKKMAVHCICDAASSYAGRELIPHTVPPKEGDLMISISPDFALKIMLRNAMFEKNIRVSDIAKAWNIRPQSLFRVIDFERASKLSNLMPIFDFIGCPLKISC